MEAGQSNQSVLVSGSLYSQSIPIHVPFTISRESLPTANIILVEIIDRDGRKGLGECAPFPSLTHDTISSAQTTARGLLDEIQGCAPEEAIERLRNLKSEAIRQSITGFVGVEGAVWDLCARGKGQPLMKIWGNGTQTTLMTDITLPIMEPSAIRSFWNIYGSYGFQTIKVKVSGHPEQDLAMIRALQEIVGPKVAYILDGNQGFTVENARILVNRLQSLEIKPIFFEQPLPEKDHSGLLRLSRSLPIPICVDETVRTVQDLQQLLDSGMKPIVNIKLMKSGIEESLRIIALAQKAGCPLMIGGMLESEVAMGLSLQMACGTGAIRYADLDTPFFFKERVCEDSPWHPCHAELHVLKGNGHALTRKSR